MVGTSLIQKNKDKSWCKFSSKCPYSPDSTITSVSDSSDSFQLEETLWNLQESTALSKARKSESKVRFGMIQMRDYERIASDNPAVQCGVPIGIGWNYIPYKDLTVDNYEEYRGIRRLKEEMRLSAFDRKCILCQEWNYNQEEIRFFVRASMRVRNQRQCTIRRESSLVQKNFRRGIDLLSECIGPIKEIWRNDEETELLQQDFMEDAKNYVQNSVLDTTKSNRIVDIDKE